MQPMRTEAHLMARSFHNSQPKPRNFKDKALPQGITQSSMAKILKIPIRSRVSFLPQLHLKCFYAKQEGRCLPVAPAAPRMASTTASRTWISSTDEHRSRGHFRKKRPEFLMRQIPFLVCRQIWWILVAAM